MDSPALSGKRKVSLISPNSVKSSPEEKRTREEEFCEVSENDEATTALDMAGDLATKMDLALSKLEKLDTIEKRLDSVIASFSSIEETVGRLDKDVLTLKKKTSETERRVNELEEGAKFNETELSDVKRDTKKAQFDTEELRKQLLYLEAYSRRENLKFAGIPENIPEGQQMENTKELVYEFLEKELKIANPRDRIEFQRIHRLGKPSWKGPRLIIARFLRFSDREEVLSQARANPGLKEKDLYVYDDLPKDLYDLRKKQVEKLKQAKKNGFSARFSKSQPDKLFVNGKYIAPDEPIS